MAWWEDEHNHLNLTLTQQREEQAGALIMMDRGRGDSQRVAGRGARLADELKRVMVAWLLLSPASSISTN